MLKKGVINLKDTQRAGPVAAAIQGCYPVLFGDEPGNVALTLVELAGYKNPVTAVVVAPEGAENGEDAEAHILCLIINDELFESTTALEGSMCPKEEDAILKEYEKIQEAANYIYRTLEAARQEYNNNQLSKILEALGFGIDENVNIIEEMENNIEEMENHIDDIVYPWENKKDYIN